MTNININLSDSDMDGLRNEVRLMVKQGIEDATSEIGAESDILSSVKAVQSYLDCSYATYKKLLAYGLPVHFFSGTTFGSKAEIRNWIQKSGDRTK